MKLFGAFREFAKRVLNAVKKGGLPRIDQIKLDHLLKKTGRRNLILSRAILSALDAGGASKRDIQRFGELLEQGNHRIINEKDPFTKKEKTELATIFRRASLTRKTTRKFSGDLDELLADQIQAAIKGKKKIPISIPKKKTIRLKRRKEKKILRA